MNVRTYILKLKRNLNRFLSKFSHILFNQSMEHVTTFLASSIKTNSSIYLYAIYTVYKVRLVETDEIIKDSDYIITINIATGGAVNTEGVTIVWKLNPSNVGTFYMNSYKVTIADIYNAVYACIGRYTSFNVGNINFFLNEVINGERLTQTVYTQRRLS